MTNPEPRCRRESCGLPPNAAVHLHPAGTYWHKGVELPMHAFVAPQEPATPRAATREYACAGLAYDLLPECMKCGHPHIAYDNAGTKWAAWPECRVIGCGCTSFVGRTPDVAPPDAAVGDTETPPAPTPLTSSTAKHDPCVRALGCIFGRNHLGKCSPPLDSEPQAPTRRVVEFCRKCGEEFDADNFTTCTSCDSRQEPTLYVPFEEDPAFALHAAEAEVKQLRAALATHTRSLAALRSALLEVVTKYQAVLDANAAAVADKSLGTAPWSRAYRAFEESVRALRATLSETQPND